MARSARRTNALRSICPTNSPPAIYTSAPTTADVALRQGEVLSNLIQIHLAIDSVLSDEPLIDKKRHPLTIVVSQDCDLDWDFKARHGEAGAAQHKLVANILFCEVQPLDEMRPALREAGIAGALWQRIPNNQDARFHALPAVPPEQDADGVGLPAMGVDFKRCFTIPTDEVYVRLVVEARRRAVLDPVRAIDLSQRFAYFHSRVAIDF